MIPFPLLSKEALFTGGLSFDTELIDVTNDATATLSIILQLDQFCNKKAIEQELRARPVELINQHLAGTSDLRSTMNYGKALFFLLKVTHLTTLSV